MPDTHPMSRGLLRVTFLIAVACTVTTASCVNVDPQTDEVIPRGDQHNKFEDVEQNVERLKLGMSKYQVLTLLGSPAEKSEAGDVWVYVPERPAVIVPARALRLEFSAGKLVEHGYHTIVLGKRL